MAYLDDPDANQDVARHLKQCPYCSEKAKNLESFQKRLTKQLYRSSCPSPMELGEYHLRKLPDPRRLVIAQHLQICPYCVQEVSELEEFLGDLPPQPSLLEPIKVFFAHLVSGGAQMALRGEASTSRVFMVNDIVISLDVQSGSDGEISIQGSVGALDEENQKQWTGARVELKQTYLAPLLSYVDEYGGFSFSEVFPSLTQVTILSPTGIAVQTEQVDLTI